LTEEALSVREEHHGALEALARQCLLLSPRARCDLTDESSQRLAECFDEMAQEFLPTLKAAARHRGMSRRIKTKELARYIVTILEEAIMQGRTLGDAALLRRQFACLKEYSMHRLTT
jgi:hypothetical protein